MRRHEIDYSLCLLLYNRILSDNCQHRGESSSNSTTQDSATAGGAITIKTIDVRWILRDFFAGLFMFTNDMKEAIVCNKLENFQRNASGSLSVGALLPDSPVSR